MKVALTKIKYDDSENTPCDKRKRTSLKLFKKGYTRLDTILVTSQNTNQLKSSQDGVHAGERHSGIQVISAIVNSKIRTEWGSTGNLSMKLPDSRVNSVVKKQKKSIISSSTI